MAVWGEVNTSRNVGRAHDATIARHAPTAVHDRGQVGATPGTTPDPDGVGARRSGQRQR